MIFALAAFPLLADERKTPTVLQASSQPPKTFDLKAIDVYVAAQVHEKGYVGLSLAIFKNGDIVLAKGYGKTSVEGFAPVQVNTPFAIGSITKQFVCACALLLAEDGKLSVRDQVAKYYPGLTRAKDITLYDLMTHASGYPDYYPLDFVDRRMLQPATWDKIITEYATGKLDFEPGTRWSYSNTGYTILGRIVEKVSGEPFGKFLQQRILQPLKMKHSHFLAGRDRSGLARGHTSFALGPPQLATPEAEGWIDAAGGMYATASDLARWDLALVNGQVLKPESYRLMTTPRQLANGKIVDYGCGLRVMRRDGEQILSHNGAVSGFLAYNSVMPRARSGVAVLANSEHLSPSSLHATILGLLLKDLADREGPSVPKVAGQAPKAAALEFFHQMQSGAIDRAKLGEQFNWLLNEERIRSAAIRLKPLGEPEKVEALSVAERGGREVASIRLTFKTITLAGLLYRSPDGKIQQMLFNKE